MPHLHEKIDFVSNVYIVHGDAVLLRKHDKYGHWWPPGGHIELHEDPAEAAVREAQEEVGMDVALVSAFPIVESEPRLPEDGRDLIMPYFMNRHRISDTHEHVSFEFFGTTDTREIRQTVEREHSDNIRWFTREELNDPAYGIGESIKRYARLALDTLGA